MQLNSRRGGLTAALGLLTANLLAASSAQAQDTPAPASQSAEEDETGSFLDDTASEPGSLTLDFAVLFYQEQGGRVRAIEPAATITLNRRNGDVFTAGTTYDTLTGATPNGAAPWTAAQTFVNPVQPLGSQKALTSASGKHKTLVTLPGGAVVQQYIAAPNTLPLERDFTDDRHGVELGWTHVLDPETKISFGLSGSNERDYRSFSGNLGLSRDLPGKNTTLSLAGNIELDQARPLYGIPVPLTPMSSLTKGPYQSKRVYSLVAGVTQLLSRNWLVQLNYSWGSGEGYQTDPYKIVSVVSAATGAPLSYLYESRPRSRVRQSLYLASKLSIGSAVTDVSLRYYHDSWKIGAMTAEASETFPIGKSFYVAPGARYYHQTGANFFNYYLLGAAPLPEYASSDARLARFSAVTFSLKGGAKLSPKVEVYLLGEDYRQSGTHHPAGAPGALAGEDFFAGVHAFSAVAGLKYHFR